MNALNNMILFSTLSFAIALPIQADEPQVDPYKQKILYEYDQLSQPVEWVNLLISEPVDEPKPSLISGDIHLDKIVGQYTLKSLDRGGWVNTVLNNSNYSSGNALLAVKVGEGVTLNVKNGV